MQKYKDFQPTGFDTKGLNADRYDIGDFFVLLSQDRDSEALDKSNFEVALEILGGESDKVQVHRFGHWACGWFELILVHPDLEKKAQEIEDSLADYPILNEEHYSQLEWDEMTEAGYTYTDQGWQYIETDSNAFYATTIGNQYEVESEDHGFLGSFVEYDDVLKAVREWSEKENWFPNLYFVSDHGNIDNKPTSY